MRAPVVVLFLLTASSACATGSEIWLIPQVMVQPGSPVVVISNSKLRTVEHSDSGWFMGATSSRGVDLTTVAWSFQTLDARTCKAGPVRKYTQSVEVVGWGTAPGELWVRSPENAPTVRSLDGRAQIDIGKGCVAAQGEPLPVSCRDSRPAAALTPVRGGAADSTDGDLVGSASYYVDPLHREQLLAVEPSSGRRWTAATDIERIRSAVGVPAARKVVIIDEQRRVLTFDVDSRRLQVCQ